MHSRGPARPPHLRASRAALELLEAIGHARPHFDFADVLRATKRPRTTLVRLLNELVSLDLVVRLRRDDYATPRRSTHALLLVEPNAYYRSLLATDDVLRLRGERRHAYACLPVRHALDFELPQALVVIPPGPDLKSARPLFPYALRAAVAGASEIPVQFPSDERESEAAFERTFAALSPRHALALLAATAEPRLVRAVRSAAPRFGLHAKDVLEESRRFVLEEPPVRTLRRNTLVLPRWLHEFATSASKVHARRFLQASASEVEPP